MNAVRKESCEQDYINYGIEQVINDGRICAGGQTEYDTCAGKLFINHSTNDLPNYVTISFITGYTGAPLVILDNSSQRWSLVGIKSIGPSCEGRGTPGIYTRVSKYIGWILENIENRNIIISF